MLNNVEGSSEKYLKKSTFHQVFPQCLGNAETVQKWKMEENKKLINVQKHYFILWGKVEIKVEIKCFFMLKYYRTAANKLISTVTILVQDSCLYSISKSL